MKLISYLTVYLDFPTEQTFIGLWQPRHRLLSNLEFTANLIHFSHIRNMMFYLFTCLKGLN